MSGNEVERLKSLRGKLAVLCPETDGLQAKHRIKRTLKGKTRKEQEGEILEIVVKEHIVFDHFYRDAKLASLIFLFDGFSSREVFQILSSNRYR